MATELDEPHPATEVPERIFKNRARKAFTRVRPHAYSDPSGMRLVRDDNGPLLTSVTYGDEHLPLFDLDLDIEVDGNELTFPSVIVTRNERRSLQRRLVNGGLLFSVPFPDLQTPEPAPLRLVAQGECPHRHLTVIDVVPSSTPGHWHVYYAEPVRWRYYRRTLLALARAGVIEDDWVALVTFRGYGALYAPGTPE